MRFENSPSDPIPEKDPGPCVSPRAAIRAWWGCRSARRGVARVGIRQGSKSVCIRARAYTGACCLGNFRDRQESPVRRREQAHWIYRWLSDAANERLRDVSHRRRSHRDHLAPCRRRSVRGRACDLVYIPLAAPKLSNPGFLCHNLRSHEQTRNHAAQRKLQRLVQRVGPASAARRLHSSPRLHGDPTKWLCHLGAYATSARRHVQGDRT